jgi:hypothetical protein
MSMTNNEEDVAQQTFTTKGERVGGALSGAFNWAKSGYRWLDRTLSDLVPDRIEKPLVKYG